MIEYRTRLLPSFQFLNRMLNRKRYRIPDFEHEKCSLIINGLKLCLFLNNGLQKKGSWENKYTFSVYLVFAIFLNNFISYCLYQIVFEKRFGFLSLKPQFVYFFVQRKSSYDGHDKPIIPFQVLINIGQAGQAMDYATGTFIAPKDGIYHFFFSGIKDWNSYSITIFLCRNGQNIAKAVTTVGFTPFQLLFRLPLNLRRV